MSKFTAAIGLTVLCAAFGFALVEKADAQAAKSVGGAGPAAVRAQTERFEDRLATDRRRLVASE